MLKKPKVEEVVTEMSEPLAGSLELELVDVEFVKEGPSWFLRIFIDKPGGITHDDCKAMSQKLSDLLDEKDPIPQSYILEVSSPGIERPLKKAGDFVRFSGHKVRASLFAAVDGQKELVGELEGLRDENVIINVKGKEYALSQDSISKIRLEAEF